MTKYLATLAVAALLTSTGCAGSADVESVPVGSEVDIVRQDGGVVHGTQVGRDEKTVKLETGTVKRSVPREQIADMRVVDPARPAPLPPAAKFRELTLPEGTTLVVRLQSAVASDTSRGGIPSRRPSPTRWWWTASTSSPPEAS